MTLVARNNGNTTIGMMQYDMAALLSLEGEAQFLEFFNEVMPLHRRNFSHILIRWIPQNDGAFGGFATSR